MRGVVNLVLACVRFAIFSVLIDFGQLRSRSAVLTMSLYFSLVSLHTHVSGHCFRNGGKSNNTLLTMDVMYSR